MSHSIDLGSANSYVRDFIRELGPIREPIDLVSEGTIVARIIPPTELSDAEKRQAFERSWQLVKQARERTAGVPEREIAKLVDEAVDRVRSQP
ncbi:MAG: hypothetical protein KF708_08730 [Pirellulales bacterium]|nr:hypothetical protein [Pirellulales bacterium]